MNREDVASKVRTAVNGHDISNAITGEHVAITSGIRNAAARALVGNEVTNAVNSGLVGSAANAAKDMVIAGSELQDLDAMYQTGKGAVKGAVSTARVGSDLVKGSAAAAKEAKRVATALRNGEKVNFKDNLAKKNRQAIGKGIKGLGGAAKDAAKDGLNSAKNAAIQDTELQDVDEAYQKVKALKKDAKGVVKSTRNSWRLMRQSTARIKALAHKRITAKAGNTFNTQMYKYMRAAAYRSVRTGGGALSTIKATLQYVYYSIRMAMSGIGAVIGVGVALLGFLPLLIAVFGLIFAGGFLATQDSGTGGTVGSLTGNEAAIAQYLLDKGVDRTHTAAIMGNMFQESGCRPDAINSSSGAYGICQWLGGRKDGLANLAKEKHKEMSDIDVQLDWFWHEFNDPYSGWNKAQYLVFNSENDLKKATWFFRARFERCGEDEAADNNRYENAKRIYDAMGSANGTNGIDGNGQDLKKATAKQKAVIDAANSTKSPGQGYCAMWVSQVFQNAGYQYYTGNACDMCRAWCTSTNVKDLKVGMIIADESHPGTGWAGTTYGHIGIYIGDNKVISNEGSINIKSLDTFVKFYGAGTGCKWGWIGGIDLTK